MIPRFNSLLLSSHSLLNSWKRCSSLIQAVNSAHGEMQVADSKSATKPENQAEDEFSNESPYYIENGLRKVYPYYFSFTTHCKARWVNRTFFDVICKEFALYSIENVKTRFLIGRIKVNGEVIGQDYKLKDNDLITSTIHRHELPVLAATIKILHEDDDLLIVDKPSSLPVHPCGMYRYNTVVFLLGQQQKWRNLLVLHRLDRLTSGVLMFAKNSNKSRQMHKELNSRQVRKVYVCRVEGEFPDGIISCDKPLQRIYSKMGISLVSSQGKECFTEFQKLSYNGESSVILCKPLTGRTHQIRVHLQYLGHPILNDPLYNSYAFGPDKGKHGNFHKSVQQLLLDLLEEHSYKNWLVNCNKNLANRFTVPHLQWEVMDAKYKKDETRITHDEHCSSCQEFFIDPSWTDLFMFLHALKYTGEKWEFRSDMPEWATSDWNCT